MKNRELIKQYDSYMKDLPNEGPIGIPQVMSIICTSLTYFCSVMTEAVLRLPEPKEKKAKKKK